MLNWRKTWVTSAFWTEIRARRMTLTPDPIHVTRMTRYVQTESVSKKWRMRLGPTFLSHGFDIIGVFDARIEEVSRIFYQLVFDL